MRRSIAAAVLVVAGLCAAHLAAQSRETVDALKAEYDRGWQMRLRGNSIGAQPVLQHVAEAASQLGEKLLLQQALSGLAIVRSDLGDYAGMLDYAQRAYDAAPDPNGIARVKYLNERGRVLQELRERDQAFAAYTEAIALAQKLGEEGELTSLYNEIGLATWRLDRNREQALKYYDEGIALSRRRHDNRGLMVIYNNSGNLFRHPGGYDEAERRYREGIAAADRLGIPGGDAFLLKNMGVVYRETGRLKEAERSLLAAVRFADERGSGRIQWQGRMELGTFYRERNPALAADYFEQTLKALEALNNNVLLEGFRAGSLSGAVTIYDDPYDLYTDLLLKNGKEREAFAVAERARARAFLDTLSLAREEIARALPEDFVREERGILDRISASQAALRAGGVTAARRNELQAAIAADEDQLTRIRVRLVAENPALANARYPKLWTVDDVQANLLKKDEALLQYFLGAQHGTLWAITTSGVHVRRLPPRADIETAVRAYLETVGRPDTDYRTAAKSLGSTLLPDLGDVLGGASRLIVVPHGILNYVPFETLFDARDRFLVQDHAISYAPSTSSLGFLRSRQSTGTEVIALGNAVMQAEGVAAERGQSWSRVGALKPLLHSGPEVRAVARVYGSAAHVFEQQTATELVLTEPAASRAGIIHIATHGLIDEDMPERSGLALSATSQSDGILQMREVYNLKLNAALVSLSACQTALGKAITGEGMVGLSRAFFYAGSNAVLASLWNVNDASTARLMRPFYESLAGGAPIDAALRSAKLELLNQGGRLAHPYYWAPFVVNGHGAAVVPVRPQSRFSGGFLWSGGLALALLLMAGAFARRRVR